MLRAALRKFSSISAPSIISALSRPSLPNCAASALVLASFSVALSMTMMPPSLAFADSACLSASARTFFGRLTAWLRTTGPNARPPPRNCGTRAEPWRAPPVPFCAYIFLPVRQISSFCLTLWVPRWRLASCQLTQRCTMSTRGSRPKISSDRLTEPASLPSCVVIFMSMLCALLLGRGGIGSRRFGRLGVGFGGFAEAELAGLRRILMRLLFHGIAYGNPAALGARHRTLDQDQAPLDVGLDHFEIERGDAVDAHVTGHLLVLEGLARVLTAAGRTDRAVRDRHAVRGAQAAEVPALHAAGKTLADRDAADIDELTFDEMIGGDFSADRDQGILGDAEFRKLAARLDVGLTEITAVGLAHVVGAAQPGTELQRDVAILILGAMGNDLTLLKLHHRNRHVFSSLGEHPGHSDLFSHHSRTHLQVLIAALELDLDVDAGGQVELHQRVHGLRRRIDDIQKALMGAHFELFAALLIDVR